MLLQRRLLSTSTQLPKALIPKTGKRVTRLGFGGYRVSNESHANALRTAIQAGVNIIDTAANFENGASETVIGNTLADLDTSDLTVVTKSGYLTQNDIEGANPSDYVQINPKSFHTLAPSFLEKQIETSLQRLKTNKLDIFMINAPERMLMAKNKTYGENHLYKDLAKSFRYLDDQVAQGVIGGYGVCSNTMALPSAQDHVSLPRVLEACENHNNLVAIQVPFNIFEREAIVPNALGLASPEKTVADVAEEHGIYLMANRPLNAIAEGRIRVLVNHVVADNENPNQMMERISQTFQHVAELEQRMMTELPLEEEALTAKFVWGEILSENLNRLSQNHFATRHYLTKAVLPALDRDLGNLRHYAETNAPEKAVAFEDWISHYRKGIHDLADDIVAYAYIDTLRKNGELDRILNAMSPTLGKQHDKAHSPLSVKALRLLLAEPQIGTVFTGMRDIAYVQDALLAARKSIEEPMSDEEVDTIWQSPIF
ncbi:NADP-dependent oxidoreductase domain-containing protein [Syncephalastrum racemosum]|uniref:NADP-dependent oxidoreductase domain-containing protein n=1 Tax=Syncephalastrum racemosum TaxID=13706 RepID=A0A1X2GZX3_SYNRA|nr:NADP-dependent oxidoreductase domain-containing protein [Syncephalastrum racemosum]